MPNATKLPASMEIETDCLAPGCLSGKIKHQHIRIDPAHMDFHLKNHAYKSDDIGHGRQPIGANCTCPRVIDAPTYADCQACKGTGHQIYNLTIPKSGTKVKVRDPQLLEDLFGENMPEKPGIVFDTQGPDEHGLELRTGIGVRVTWDRLTKEGKIPQGENIALWTFDLTELVIV